MIATTNARRKQIARQQRRAKKEAEGRPASRPPRGEVEIVSKRLTKTEARGLLDKFKTSTVERGRWLLALYEGGGPAALGYDSFDACVRSELSISRVHGHRLLKAAIVIKELGSNPGATERVLRELSPLVETPTALREIWQELQRRYEKPTHEQTREAVKAYLHEPPRQPALEAVADDEIAGDDDADADIVDTLNSRTNPKIDVADAIRTLVDKTGDAEHALELVFGWLVEEIGPDEVLHRVAELEQTAHASS
jgi:hypothetical protein